MSGAAQANERVAVIASATFAARATKKAAVTKAKKAVIIAGSMRFALSMEPL